MLLSSISRSLSCTDVSAVFLPTGASDLQSEDNASQQTEGPDEYAAPDQDSRYRTDYNSSRACVVVHTGAADFKQECIDISEDCEEFNCTLGTVCGLNPEGNLQCFADSVREEQTCGSEELRLSEPCPIDTDIIGFGQGCTFCGSETTSLLEYGRNACVVVYLDSGEPKQECVDISEQCEELSCANGTVCGLDLDEQLQCFNDSVKELQTCGPEELRLFDPCPFGTSILGFGQGCTFCEADESDNPRACFTSLNESATECVDIADDCEQLECASDEVCGLDLSNKVVCFQGFTELYKNCEPEEFRLSEPCPADFSIVLFGQDCTYCNDSSSDTEALPAKADEADESDNPRACFTSLNEFATECVDIADDCEQLECASDEVCGLDLSNKVVCFQDSMELYKNCEPEEFRLSEPCPADFSIVLFGQGCTYCIDSSSDTEALPANTLPVAVVARGPSSPPSPSRISFVSNKVKRIIEKPAKCRSCKTSVCVLDTGGNAYCVASWFLKKYSPNCGSELRRLPQPCPAGGVPEIFTAGCTYCRPPNQYPDVARLRACPVTRNRRSCTDISERCLRRGCGGQQVCVMGSSGNVLCMNRKVLKTYNKNCGSELKRLKKPCPSGGVQEIFAAGCTFCRPPIQYPDLAQSRACPVTRNWKGCIDISAKCRRKPCSAIVAGGKRGQTCVLNLNGKAQCVKNRILEAYTANCGNELKRLYQPCPVGGVPKFFSAGCTLCMKPACLTVIGNECVTPERIGGLCRRARCRIGTQCALRVNGRTACVPTSQMIVFCGTPRQRRNTPCHARYPLRKPVAYGTNCNFC